MPSDRWPYNTDEWQHARAKIRFRDGHRCFCCGREGQVDTHHEQPLKDGGAPFDLDNLASVCRGCHDLIHRRLTRIGPYRRRSSWCACYDVMLAVKQDAKHWPFRAPPSDPSRRPTLTARDERISKSPVPSRPPSRERERGSGLAALGCATAIALYLLFLLGLLLETVL